MKLSLRRFQGTESDLKESVEAYKFIKNNYGRAKINLPLFRFVYRSFYRMSRNVPAGSDLDESYFKLLFDPKIQKLAKEDSKKALEQVLTKLYNIDKTWHFSFATKMLHTMNPHLPIYDSIIAKRLKLPHCQWIRKGKNSKEAYQKELNNRIKIYSELKNQIDIGVKVKENSNIIIKWKQKYDAEKISNEKALDFILWNEGKKKFAP